MKKSKKLFMYSCLLGLVMFYRMSENNYDRGLEEFIIAYKEEYGKHKRKMSYVNEFIETINNIDVTGLNEQEKFKKIFLTVGTKYEFNTLAN